MDGQSKHNIMVPVLSSNLACLGVLLRDDRRRCPSTESLKTPKRMQESLPYGTHTCQESKTQELENRLNYAMARKVPVVKSWPIDTVNVKGHAMQL